MDSRFDDLFTRPENEIFRVVFFPDRIYHARHLTASISDRYRYDVDEVRTKSGYTAMKGTVYLDGAAYTPFFRIEYKAARLVETAREKGRTLEDRVKIWVRLEGAVGAGPGEFPQQAETELSARYCPLVDAYCAEVWGTTRTDPGTSHAIRVLHQMGDGGSISSIPAFNPWLQDIEQIRRVATAAREDDIDRPTGYAIDAPAWDNFYTRNIQVPNSLTPSDHNANTVDTGNYVLDFQRGYLLQTDQIEPVRYRNAMMNDGDPEQDQDNIVDMRWLLQQELGGDLVFFHEVTVPPGVIEGTHRHIGSEELYYIVRGEGIAYMGHKDDPSTAHLPVVKREIYGLDPYECREVPVRPGSVIFTKSGGIHGIQNMGSEPLVFVAFLYQGT